MMNEVSPAHIHQNYISNLNNYMSDFINKLTKSTFLFLATGLSMGLVSCSDDYRYEAPKIGGIPFNRSLPMAVSEILPDSGGYLTQFVIKGSNFGTDPSKIDVIFNGNRKATVVSSDGTTLYGICPKQENGLNQVTVRVDSVGDPTVCPNRFKYTKVERVSVLAGKTGNGGYVDGNPIDARFNYMYGVVVVTGNNVIVMEGRNNRVRMISETDNKVITLLTGGPNFGHPAVTANRKRLYAIQIQQPHAVYCFDQTNNWSAKRLVTSLQYKDGASLLKTVDGDIYACAMDDEEKFLYFRDHKGRFGRMEIANPDNVEILNENCGTVDKNTSYLAWSKVDKCFYLSVQNAQCIYKVSKDGQTVEQFAGFNGVGSQDGPRMSASFKNPTGMAFDVDGNMYVTESMGFTIRKIGHTDGMVTTVAGIYTKSDNNKVEGLPLETTFNYPYDISVDDEGNFYIIEGWGSDVRKFAIE